MLVVKWLESEFWYFSAKGTISLCPRPVRPLLKQMARPSTSTLVFHSPWWTKNSSYHLEIGLYSYRSPLPPVVSIHTIVAGANKFGKPISAKFNICRRNLCPVTTSLEKSSFMEVNVQEMKTATELCITSANMSKWVPGLDRNQKQRKTQGKIVVAHSCCRGCGLWYCEGETSWQSSRASCWENQVGKTDRSGHRSSTCPGNSGDPYS